MARKVKALLRLASELFRSSTGHGHSLIVPTRWGPAPFRIRTLRQSEGQGHYPSARCAPVACCYWNPTERRAKSRPYLCRTLQA